MLLTIAAASTFSWFYKSKYKIPEGPIPTAFHYDNEYRKELVRLKYIGNSIETYALAGNYNNHYCFLVDMKLSSGRNRFFIYDLKNDSVLNAGLVTHGSGSDYGDGKLYFSNTPGSNCTSLGKYKIGDAYNGKFGLAYKLYGLDITNNQAFNRSIVLHSHSCVPDNEVIPREICRSLGCPTVSPVFLTVLKAYLDKTEKPILLWIFY